MAIDFLKKALVVSIPAAKKFFSISCIVLLTTINLNFTAVAQHNNHWVDTVKPRLITEYHTNGRIKVTGYQGYYSDQHISTGTFVGIWRYYDHKGNLTHSTNYHNDIPSKAFITKKRYYPNGRLKSVETFNNYELYESEVVPLGKWKYYDRRGKLIKEITH